MENLENSLKEIREILQKTMQEYNQESEDFWNSLTYKQQGQAFYHVVKNIMQKEKEGYSYRGMLYDVFNFEPDMYAIGMEAGYLDLHNILYKEFNGDKSE